MRGFAGTVVSFISLGYRSKASLSKNYEKILVRSNFLEKGDPKGDRYYMAYLLGKLEKNKNLRAGIVP